MRPDIKLILLFSFPVIAALSCVALSFFDPAPKPFVPERPAFLTMIDQLSVSSVNNRTENVSARIRNVFTREEPAAAESEEPAPVEKSVAAHEPVSVSMIVDSGTKSFCVVNGKAMRLGEKNGSFSLTAIRKNAITIRYQNGIEETIHVKAF